MVIILGLRNRSSSGSFLKFFIQLKFDVCLPALVVFSDGRYIGAILDRNGLRPARYYATTDGMVLMSSEVGVVDIPDTVGVQTKGRLKPGRLLIVDTKAGELLNDEQLKESIASRYPIDDWVRQGVSEIDI